MISVFKFNEEHGTYTATAMLDWSYYGLTVTVIHDNIRSYEELTKYQFPISKYFSGLRRYRRMPTLNELLLDKIKIGRNTYILKNTRRKGQNWSYEYLVVNSKRRKNKPKS